MELKIKQEEVTEFIDDRDEIDFDVTEDLKKRYCNQKKMPVPNVFEPDKCRGCYHYEICSMIEQMAKTIALLSDDVNDIGEDLSKLIGEHNSCHGCKHEH